MAAAPSPSQQKLAAASEFRPDNIREVLSRAAVTRFFCNDERNGRGIEVHGGLKVGQATHQFGCFVRIEVDKTAATASKDPGPKSAFEVMMMASREHGKQTMMFPDYAGSGGDGETVNNNVRGDIRLYNDIVNIMKSQNFRFERNKGNESASGEIITTLRNAVWYVLPHLKTLAGRCVYLPEQFCSLYHETTMKQSYNNPTHHRHTLYPMSSSELAKHAQELFKVASLPLLQKPNVSKVKDIVIHLGQGLHRYSDHLQASNSKVQAQRKQLFPVRSLDDGVSTALRVVEAKVRSDTKLVSRYAELESHLAKIAEYELCFLDDFAPSDYRKRYIYVSELALPMSVEVYTYKTGNNQGSLHFLWKVPVKQEDRELNTTNKLMYQAEKDMPVYHTREMRKRFRERFSLVTNAKPVVLKEVYQFLTNDVAADECTASKDVRQRLKLLLDVQDPDLVVDMRSMNEGHKEKYQHFWDEATKMIEEMQLATVDDRRHGQVCHMALAMSVPDFITQVCKRLPEEVEVPTATWVSLQFWPKNPFVDQAIRYTGRLNVKYMVQSRQLNHDHIDAHYAAAILKYLKSFSVMFKEHTALVFLDDKHGIKVGEPGYPVAAVDRGKSVLVSRDSVFAVADHDFTKLKITPSVTLVCDVPESASDSFYRGKVYIALKDATFQPSSPIRHQTELYEVLNQAGKLGLPILCQYSDGGPDHRLTYNAPAPQNSFRNPVERIMSVLNLSLQAIGIMRQKMSPEMEKLFLSVGSMKDARALAEKNPGMKQAIVESTEHVRGMLNALLQCLSLKSEPFSTVEPATDLEVEEMWNLILMVDNTVTKADTTKLKLQSRKELLAFMQHCCVSRHYLFTVKKCGTDGCQHCKRPRLPAEVFSQLKEFPDPMLDNTGEHYRPFTEVYGSETTEADRPSLKVSRTTGHGMPFSPTAENTRAVVLCLDCNKPRTVHSQRALSVQQRDQLEQLREEAMYTCGVPWAPEAHPLGDICFVSRGLACSTPVDFHYFSARVKSRALSILPLVCWKCGETETLPIAPEKKEEFQSVHPVCQVCKATGVEERTRVKRKMKRRREEVDN
ncbi:Hypp4174 [Branchiostoma lanceolatum]|uniref:Hypp4174 protein n=1 Tax=Branchiostoma lanceolatum TaxID=7740 RepID=A0A8K0A8K5_BRALA|nr:Hypp4174 [Branchiostoma lanceolatum]